MSAPGWGRVESQMDNIDNLVKKVQYMRGRFRGSLHLSPDLPRVRILARVQGQGERPAVLERFSRRFDGFRVQEQKRTQEQQPVERPAEQSPEQLKAKKEDEPADYSAIQDLNVQIGGGQR